MKLSFALLLLFITGCSAQYTRNIVDQSLTDTGLKKQYRVTRGADWVLAANSKVTVVPLSLNDYSEIPRSAYTFNEVLLSTFQKHFYFTDTTPTFEQSKQTWGYDIIVVSKLGDIENHLNTKAELFEGASLHKDKELGRDLVRIELIVFDARSLAFLDKIQVELKGAYFEDSDRTPVTLIEHALERAVESLVAVRI